MDRDDVRHVVGLLNQTNTAYWLIGGVAIELVVERTIRAHRDIDMFIGHTHLQRCIDHVVAAGFAIVPGTYGDEGVCLQKDDLLVDCTNVRLLSEQALQTFGIYATIAWPHGLLQTLIIDVDGEPCRTLTASNHLAMKHVVAEWGGAALRPTNEEDIRMLEAHGSQVRCSNVCSVRGTSGDWQRT